MSLHVTRLIVTIILFMLALAGLAAGHWFQALFWALIAVAVGYPFVRNGRLDLHYARDPLQVVVYEKLGSQPLAPVQTAAPAVM